MKYSEYEDFAFTPSSDIASIRQMVQNCSDHQKNFEEEHGRSLLLGAIRHCYVEIVEFLMQEQLVDVNPSSSLGHVPLIHSYLPHTKTKGLRIAKLLQQNGANPNARDEDGKTAMHVGTQTFQGYEILKVLLENLQDVVDIEARDKKSSRTPLHSACEVGSEPLIGLLLEHGADVSAKDKDNRTPLHVYCGHQTQLQPVVRAEIVRMLLTKDPACADVVDKCSGRTPLHSLCDKLNDLYAKTGDPDSRISKDESFGIVLDASHKALGIQDHDGNTPLAIALQCVESGWRNRNFFVPFIEKVVVASSDTTLVDVMQLVEVWKRESRNLSIPTRIKVLILERSSQLDENRYTPLLIHCSQGGGGVGESADTMETLQMLLKRDASAASKVDCEGSTALHYVFSDDNFNEDGGDDYNDDHSDDYSDAGSDVSMTSNNSNEANIKNTRQLHSVEFVSTLLQAFPGAAGVRDKEGYLPLWWALENRYPADLLDVLVKASPVDDELLENMGFWDENLSFATKMLLVERYSTTTLGKPDGYARMYPIHLLVQCPLPVDSFFTEYIDQFPHEKVFTLNEHGELPLHTSISCSDAKKFPLLVVEKVFELERRAAAVKDPRTGFYPYEAATCRSQVLIQGMEEETPRLLDLVFTLLRQAPHVLRDRLVGSTRSKKRRAGEV